MYGKISREDLEPRSRPKGHTGERVNRDSKAGHRKTASEARLEFKEKSTQFMCGELAKFVSQLLGKPVDPNFVKSLRSGVELCDLVEKVSLGSVKVKKISRELGNTAMHKARYINNIGEFHQACARCGVDPQDMAEQSCFEGSGSMDPILNNLYALLGIALRNGIAIPESLMHKVKEKKIKPLKPIAPKELESLVRLKVLLPGGDKIDVKVRKTDNIYRIKELIEVETLLPASKQILYYSSMELDDNHVSVEKLNIKNDSEIELEILNSSHQRPQYLLYSCIGGFLSLVACLICLSTIFLGDWAVTYTKGDVAWKYKFGLLGYYTNNNNGRIYRPYSEVQGWDEDTEALISIGNSMLGLLFTAFVFCFATTGAFVYVFFKSSEEKLETNPSMTWKIWILDHLFIIPIAGMCVITMSIVVFSYVGAPKAYALSRFLAETTDIIFEYGTSYCLNILSLCTIMTAGSLIYYMRFKDILYRLESSSDGEKKQSTYGSLELILEPQLPKEHSHICC
mmetsp:Transcript_4588/g.8356  ORF Transcript_4588/g.8356 Transcript_4588/m.8356 type:complete len:511 (-) Transcript_4588:56-1588(-)